MDNKSLLIRGGTVISDSSAAQIDLYVQSGSDYSSRVSGEFR